MKFLNGFKTFIGLAGIIITTVTTKVAPEVVAQVGSEVVGIAEGVFGLLLTLGIVHKAEKRADADSLGPIR